MPYCREIPVRVFLRRQWGMPTTVVDMVCEGLPETYYGSYINSVWDSFSVQCVVSWYFEPQSVLPTILWLRSYGITNVQDALSVMLAPLVFMVKEPLAIYKALRLAFAVMMIGLRPRSLRFESLNTVDNNLEMLRLLCQGPWPRLEPYCRVWLATEFKQCFQLLANDVREAGDVNAMRDLCMLEEIFEKAFDVLELGAWCFNVRQDFESGPTGVPRLRDFIALSVFVGWAQPP